MRIPRGRAVAGRLSTLMLILWIPEHWPISRLTAAAPSVTTGADVIADAIMTKLHDKLLSTLTDGPQAAVGVPILERLPADDARTPRG